MTPGLGEKWKLQSRGRSRNAAVVLIVLAAIGLSFLPEHCALERSAEAWQETQLEMARDDVRAAAGEFQGLQNSVMRVAEGLAGDELVRSYLAGRDTGIADLFARVSQWSRRHETGLELYDRSGRLIAWEGPGVEAVTGAVTPALEGRRASFVASTAAGSDLALVTPVWDSKAVVGAVLARRTLEVSYPLSNRFFRREGIAERLFRERGARVTFRFGQDAAHGEAEDAITASLQSTDGARIGLVRAHLREQSQYEEEVRRTYAGIRSLLAAFAILSLLVAALGPVLRVSSAALKIGAASALIWSARYALLVLDIPSSLILATVFDPSYFASQWGGGLAKSLGELGITAGAFALNLWLAVRHARVKEFRAGDRSLGVRLIMAAASVGLLFWALRGYGAVVQSAVFDSTLSLTDALLISPSVEAGVMMAVLITISVGALVASVGCARFSARLITWPATLVLFLVAAGVFGLLSANPILPGWYRIALALLVVGLGWHVDRRHEAGRSSLSRGTLLLVFSLSGLMLFPLLQRVSTEKDQVRVEGLAVELARPVDSWLSFVLTDALGSLASGESAGVIAGGDTSAIARLAFSRWAQSVACREGYASSFAILDSAGREVSRFMIGGQSAALWSVESDLMLADTVVTQIGDLWQGSQSTKVYAGSVPIRSAGGELEGHALATIAAGSQSLFRGENPALLRASPAAALESFRRTLLLAEFRFGRLATASGGQFPVGYRLPRHIESAFEDSLTASVWSYETVDDQPYATYFFRRDIGSDEVLAIYLRDRGPEELVVGLASVIAAYVAAILLVVALYALAMALRGRRLALSFRDRLLVVLLVTAAVPLVLVLLYGRYATRERLTAYSASRLEQETAAVLSGVEAATGMADAFELRARLSDLNAENLAQEYGEDFNIYIDRTLANTSRPELFAIGILERRISGDAYANVMLRGRRFHLLNESIGRYQYAVGYRPVFDERGGIVAVLSVPTLFQQEEIEREAAREYAFLFGVASLILLSMILIATVFANRIAAPVQELTAATKRIARGDLDVSVEGSARRLPADDEIGELMRSFDAMTRDLKRSREELIRFERDLAWREMAKQVAHEIKNPLTPMKLSIQHLRQTYREGASGFGKILEEVTRTMTQQIETLNRIASEFSHFARMPKRQPVSLDVNLVAAEALQLFAREKHVTFETNLADGLPAVHADREELRRAFINILRNGLQAMEFRGRMLVTTSSDGGRVRISFRDFGPGIASDVLQNLFQPKVSTKPEGMGLGLVIVKKTIDDCGGTIHVDTVPDQGTTVTIVLPAAAQEGGERT